MSDAMAAAAEYEEKVRLLGVSLALDLGHSMLAIAEVPKPAPNTARIAENGIKALERGGFVLVAKQTLDDLSGHDQTGVDHMEEMWRIAELADDLAAAAMEEVAHAGIDAPKTQAAIEAWQGRN